MHIYMADAGEDEVIYLKIDFLKPRNSGTISPQVIT